MLLTSSQMKAAEASAFTRGVQAEALMETAGKAIANIVSQFHPRAGRLIAWGGKGNNAGDVLVAARILAERGWDAEFSCAFPETTLGKLPSKKLAEFRQIPHISHPSSTVLPLVVLDGLLGIGAKGPLRKEICTAIEAIHHLRNKHGAWVLSADIPTGLDADRGTPDPSGCIQADLTATIGFVKVGLLSDTATQYVGRLALVPLKELISNESDNSAALITPSLLQIPPRNFDTHKGTYGRVGILAGSHNFPGAARLCTHAALRAGAGYVTLFIPEELYLVIAPSLPPEAIVHPIHDFREVLQQPLNALCIGPGLGTTRKQEILDIVRDAPIASVIDADALNAVASCPNILNQCRASRLLTPHPGEFARLAPELSGLPRQTAAETFVARYPVTLLLKGARTLIAERQSPTLFNSTGNPGMASAGMGDTLTGVCGALLAYGLTPKQAASTSAWLCGRAAEIAIFSHKQSPESLLASNVIQYLGQAFKELRAHAY